MSLWVKYVPAVFMWLCVNYPVYISRVFWVWFRLVYLWLPGVSCLSALSCPALIKYYYLSLRPRACPCSSLVCAPWQGYCFSCIIDQINATLVSVRDFFHLKILPTTNFWMVVWRDQPQMLYVYLQTPSYWWVPHEYISLKFKKISSSIGFKMLCRHKNHVLLVSVDPKTPAENNKLAIIKFCS